MFPQFFCGFRFSDINCLKQVVLIENFIDFRGSVILFKYPAPSTTLMAEDKEDTLSFLGGPDKYFRVFLHDPFLRDQRLKYQKEQNRQQLFHGNNIW